MKKTFLILSLSMLLLAGCNTTKDGMGGVDTSNPDNLHELGGMMQGETDPSQDEGSNTGADKMAEASASEPCTSLYSHHKNNSEGNQYVAMDFSFPCGWRVKTVDRFEIGVSSPDDQAKFIYPSGDLGLHDGSTVQGSIEANDQTYAVTWFEGENEKGAFVDTNIGENKYDIQLQYQTEEQKTQLENIIKSLKVTTGEINPF